MKKPFFIYVMLLLPAAAFFQGCMQQKVKPLPEEQYFVQSLAISPVEAATESKYEIDQGVSHLDQNIHVMDTLFAEYFSGKKNARFIAKEQQQIAFQEHPEDQLAQYLSLAQQMKTDAILICSLHRFNQRQGGKYSIAQPASVAFKYQVIQSTNGTVLCFGEFNETQQALFDNILTYKNAKQRGFKWITAEELAREGIIKTLGQCTSLQKLE